ncbi:ABC transporter ATP-binding protein [Mycoplasmopsis canis]|nr:ABC transporter ATP-binding protein [Mycoplasmopsis canis]
MMDTKLIKNKTKKIRIWDFTKGLKFLILLTILLIAIQIFLEVMTPRFVQEIINIISNDSKDYTLYTQSEKENLVYKNGGILFLLIFSSMSISLFIQIFLISKITTQFSANIKNKIFEKLQEFSPQDLNKFTIGSIMNRLNSDVSSMERTLSMIVVSIVRSIFTFASALYFALSESYELSYIFLVTIPLSVIMFMVMLYVKKVIKKLFKFNDEFNHKLQENLNSLKTIKANTNEVHELNSIKSHTQRLTKSNLKIVLANSIGESFFMTIIFMSLILLATIGVNLFLSEKIKVGHIVLFGTYIWMITSSFLGILNIGFNLFIAVPSSKRLKELLNHETEIKNSHNPITVFDIDTIEFRNVWFKYPSNTQFTLKNLNFKVSKDSSFGIISKTGEGKSTMLKLFARFYDVSDGEVLINNINIKEYDVAKLREKIGIVFQENILFNGTIESNFKLMDPKITDEEIWDSLKKADMYEFVQSHPDKLGMKINPKGSNFSGGQRQRLSIARALLKKPKLLILDDATSAVDSKTEKSLKTTINNIEQCIKIIVSQKISTLKDSDKILVLENGEISDIDNHENLLKNNKFYKDIFDSQNSVIEAD